MNNKLEKRLKRLNRLEAPTPPQNLKDRCLNTIPVAGVTQKVTFSKAARPFGLQRAALCGTLMFSVAVSIAFWNTRPSTDGTTRPAASVAFADVFEVARRVTFFHAHGRDAIIDNEQKNPKIRDWIRSDSWYDATKGFYNQYLQDIFLNAPNNELPRGASKYTRTLTLPDGTSYRREGTSSTFDVETGDWKAIQNDAITFLTGRLSETTYLGGPKASTILSSNVGKWKGQKAQVFVLERQPSPENAAYGKRSIQMRFYVNPETKLVMAQQNFIIAATPLLIAEYEFDYNKPDAALFDVARLTEGAKRSSEKTEIRVPSKSNSKS